MTPNISVIAASRGRVPLLHKMLTSLRATADEPEFVDIVIRVDRDDPKSIQYLCDNIGLPFIVGSKLNGYATLATLTNEAGRLSRADLVLVVNDDAEFVTQGWDTKLMMAAEQFSDGIFDIGIETANADNFVFPCVSRKLINVLGCVFDERLVYTDIWLRDALLPFGRAVRVYNVEIKHNWEGITPDQAKALEIVQSAAYQQLYIQCVEEARDKIRQVIQ